LPPKNMSHTSMETQSLLAKRLLAKRAQIMLSSCSGLVPTTRFPGYPYRLSGGLCRTEKQRACARSTGLTLHFGWITHALSPPRAASALFYSLDSPQSPRQHPRLEPPQFVEFLYAWRGVLINQASQLSTYELICPDHFCSLHHKLTNH
jgi:hypothetical protein